MRGFFPKDPDPNPFWVKIFDRANQPHCFITNVHFQRTILVNKIWSNVKIRLAVLFARRKILKYFATLNKTRFACTLM